MPTRRIHPLLWTFLKLTALVTVGYFVLLAVSGLLHVVLIAAVVAALILAGFFLYNLIRRYKTRLPVVK